MESRLPTRRCRSRPRCCACLLCACLLFACVIALATCIGASAQTVDAVVVEDDTPSDRPILALDTGGHTNAVYKLLATQYGDQLISVGLDKTIRFWDITTGEPMRVLRPPIARGAFGYLFAAAVSADGKLLAVGGYRAHTPLYDHRIHLIALPEGRIVHSLKGHTYAIYDLAFSHDGRHLASASHDGTARIWDVDTGETVKTLQGHTAVVHAVAWSADDKYLVSGSLDKTARIWSAASGAATAILREHTAELMTVAWSPDGRSIATGCNDKTIRLYEPSGKLRYKWPKLPNEVTSVSFAPDSKRLLYTYGSNSRPPIGAAVLDMVDGHERRRYVTHENSVLCGVFVHDGAQVATGDSVSGIRLWDANSGATVRRLEGRGKSVISVGWSPDGQAVAWGHSTEGATINFGGHLERTFCLQQLDFGPPPDKTFFRARPQMGQFQMGIGTDGGKLNMRKVGVQRAGTILSMFTLPQTYDQVRCFSLLSGSRAAIGTSAGAYVIDTNTAQIRLQLMDRGEDIWGMAPSPDFRYLLTAGNDQIVKVWELETGHPLVSLFVAGDEWIAWTPQGYYAASLAGEGLMGWHVNQGPTQLAAYYPASQFHKSLYRPDVIRRLLATGDAYKSLELADAERTTHSQKLAISDVLPPQITVTTPAESQIDLHTAELTVEASAQPTHQDPITALRLIVNGRPYGEARSVSPLDPAAAVEQQWTLELPPGKHQVMVKAETADSYGLSRPLDVTRSADDDKHAADKPAAEKPGETQPVQKPNDAPHESSTDKSAPAGKLYVLAIGAAPDATADKPSLDAKDARSIAAALQQAGKTQFDAVVTRVLADQQATDAAVNAALEEMRSQMTLADTGIVYYAGQASVDAQGKYVLGRSRRPGPTETSGEISAAKLKSQLAAIHGRLVLVLDVTHSDERAQHEANAGFCGSSQHEDASRVDAAASEWIRELLTEDYGVAVIGGARHTAATKSTSAAGQSMLTQVLAEGIHGKADADHDGTVYLQELGQYVSERVRVLSGGKQTPTVERPHGVRSFPLARPGAPTAEGQP